MVYPHFLTKTKTMVTDNRSEGNLTLSLTFPETRQQIRVVGTFDQPQWVAKDICDVLGIGNPSKALLDFDDDEKGTITIGNTPYLVVTEPGLYRLVLLSRKPAAKLFKRWICHEVLPSIRLHGCYPPPPVPRNPTSLMLRQLADAFERQDSLEAEQQRIAQELNLVASKVRDMDADTGYITVLGYGRLKGMGMPRSDAQRHGKALAKIHRQRGIKTGKAPDERHGQVNTYRIDVVEKYFATVLGEGPCK